MSEIQKGLRLWNRLQGETFMEQKGAKCQLLVPHVESGYYESILVNSSEFFKSTLSFL